MIIYHFSYGGPSLSGSTDQLILQSFTRHKTGQIYLTSDWLTWVRLKNETLFQRLLSGSAWLLMSPFVSSSNRRGLLYFTISQPNLASTDVNHITGQLERKNVKTKWSHRSMLAQCPNEKSLPTQFYVLDLFLVFGFWPSLDFILAIGSDVCMFYIFASLSESDSMKILIF